MDRWMRRGSPLFLVAVTAVAMGCDTSAAETGEKDNLEFYYHPADGSTAFDRPMAMGSSMYMYVEPLDRELNAVVDAYAEPESVLRASVAQEEEYAIALRGQSPGEATLYAEVESRGAHLTDYIEMQVDQVDQVAMEHECTSYGDAAYLAGEPITLALERQNSAGEKLVGAAHAADGETTASDDFDTACQIWMYPEAYQDDTECDEAGLHISPIHELGEVYVEPIEGVSPASGTPSELGIHVVEKQDIEFVNARGNLREGRTRDVEIDALAVYPAEMDLCGGLDLRVEILTPSVCERASGGGTSFTVDASDENSFRMRGVNPGYCEFAVEFADRPDLGGWIFDLYVEPEN